MSSRRDFVSALAALGALGASGLHAPEALAAPPLDRRLRNRLELWQTFAKRNERMIARYHSTRWSSLLKEPLLADGTIAFESPAHLVFVDDGFSGSRSEINGATTHLATREAGEEERESRLMSRPALEWLADRLVRIFAPGDPETLIEGARAEVPKGRTPRLELLPPRSHAARLELRGITLTLDPVGGAPLRIEIAEAQGDRQRFDLSDHRQKVDPRDLERWMGAK